MAKRRRGHVKLWWKSLHPDWNQEDLFDAIYPIGFEDTPPDEELILELDDLEPEEKEDAKEETS